jgi:uncharacterized protein (DUF924 family)
MNRANDVLEFWFGHGPMDAARIEERTRFWFGGDDTESVAERDSQIAARLEPLLECAAKGEFESWEASSKRRLALIILFDQAPRNIYRGTATAFAFDTQALRLATQGMQLAADAALAPIERLFFYLPLEHAESLDVQDASVTAFERLAREAPADLREFCDSTLGYAHEHRDVIRRFGRFPARNEALGRHSTPEELEWMAANSG